MKKELLDITGMSCSACSSRIEKVVGRMDGVQEIAVNLLTNKAQVSYDESKLDTAAIIVRIEKLGFGAAVHQEQIKPVAAKPTNTAATELVEMRKRLVLSLGFTAPLFYLHMGLMYGWPLPELVLGQENFLLAALVQFFFCLPVVITGYKYFYHGLRNLWNRAPNMDSLIAIGSGAAFIYGLYGLLGLAYAFGHQKLDLIQGF